MGLVAEQLAQEEAIGKAYLLHGEMIPAGEHFERALKLATDPAVRARLQCQAASSLVATGDQRGVEYLREALQVLDPVTNPLETANALSTEGRFHHLVGRHQKAIQLLLRASELVAPAVEEATVSTFAAPMITQIYAYTAGAHQHYGLFDDADEWARRDQEFGRRHKIPFAEAIGYEFLGENAIHKGEFEAGLDYAARELEIATKLHSRERHAWSQFITSQCLLMLGRLTEAEQSFSEAIELSEAIGERRVGALLKSNFTVVLAKLGRQDEALAQAVENVAESSGSSLLYTRFESLRCLAEVHFIRAGAKGSQVAGSRVMRAQVLGSQVSDAEGTSEALSPETLRLETPNTVETRGLPSWDLAEAERFCTEASGLVSQTESRVSRLWLGPLHIEVLIAVGKPSEAEVELAAYQKLVASCQSPRFSKVAESLTASLKAPAS